MGVLGVGLDDLLMEHMSVGVTQHTFWEKIRMILGFIILISYFPQSIPILSHLFFCNLFQYFPQCVHYLVNSVKFSPKT